MSIDASKSLHWKWLEYHAATRLSRSVVGRRQSTAANRLQEQTYDQACNMTVVQHMPGSSFALRTGNLSGRTGREEGAAIMKDTQKAGEEQRMARSRYTELRKMLEDRRRQIQAEVPGKMRGVREEGSW